MKNGAEQINNNNKMKKRNRFTTFIQKVCRLAQISEQNTEVIDVFLHTVVQ